MLENLSAFFSSIGAWMATPTATFSLTRFVLLRLLGLVYFFAFLSLARQVVPLLGKNGLTPAREHLDRVRFHSGKTRRAFLQLPTIFWLNCSDLFLSILAWVGVLLSLIVTFGFANVPLLLVLWALYLSFVHVGQVWYGYGWEIQLLETGFIAIFMVPLLDLHPFPPFPTPLPAILLFLWLTFRIHLGAGLIKMRGDQCWRDLTALTYHFETQPIPNPLSRHFHFLPRVVLKAGTMWNHIVELVMPFFMLGPAIVRAIAGIAMISFQLMLMLSGNLSFLNVLTIVPIIASLNDNILAAVLPATLVQKAAAATLPSPPSIPIAAWLFFIVVAVLSIPVVRNLFSRRQMMNTSFNQLHLVNTYGAFGTVGRKRYELIIQGTDDETITPATHWKEYEFKAKPGDPARRLPIIAPYQPRIDWQVWFAAMEQPSENPWLFRLLWKLLQDDQDVLSLLANNPFAHRPPKHIRIEYYQYKFTKPGNKHPWNRKRIGSWLGPVSKETGWLKAYA